MCHVPLVWPWSALPDVLCSALNKAQKGFCTSLMMWASKTKALPPSFPKPTPRTLVPVQEQLPSQLPMEQQMQLMVHRGDVYTALPNDWIRMLDSLPDGELQGAISGFCGWLSQAYNLQKQEMKASKRVLEATRLVSICAFGLVPPPLPILLRRPGGSISWCVHIGHTDPARVEAQGTRLENSFLSQRQVTWSVSACR